MAPLPTDTASPAPFVKARLSIMMFFQYAIWGAWLPYAESFFNEFRQLSPDQVTSIIGFGAIGAIFAPFIAGQVADRYMSTEKFLGISHLIGAVLIWQLAEIENYSALLTFAIVYSMLYSPTMPLTNSLAFHHLADRDKDFGRVRLWGTIGWIAVGIGVGQLLKHYHSPAGLEPGDPKLRSAVVAGMSNAFKLSAILGAIMGLYCFTLPHTPPRKGEKQFAPLKAMGEIKRQPLLSLFLISIPVSMLHQYHMIYTGGFLGHIPIPKDSLVAKFNEYVEWVFGVGGGGIMTIGQISEIFCLAAIPFVAKRLPKKSILAIGLLCYALRFGIFAYFPTLEFVIPGLALHGPIFACFIFLAFMIVDEECTGDVRASAQGLYNLVIIGFGVVLGSKLAGVIATRYTDEVTKVRDYQSLFSVAMWAALGCLAALLLFYPRDEKAIA
ncbi:MAG: MFS transporter [Planctomycetes bacterium]|nr:MFS transporter [Planctomycetota bacterium]